MSYGYAYLRNDVYIGYIGEFEEIDDHRSGKIVIQLNGRLNKCGVISPRFNIKLGELEKWTSNLLPSRQFGFLVLTTSAGIMDHEEARRKHAGKYENIKIDRGRQCISRVYIISGGKILGFFY